MLCGGVIFNASPQCTGRPVIQRRVILVPCKNDNTTMFIWCGCTLTGNSAIGILPHPRMQKMHRVKCPKFGHF